MGESVITEVTAAIAAAQSDILAVGSAILVVAAAVFAIRWVKAQFF